MQEKLVRLLGFKSVKTVRNNLSLKSGSTNSLRAYLVWVGVFFEDRDLNPDEFVKKAEAGEVNPTEEYNRFIIDLKEKGLPNNTIASAGHSVRKFFDVNNVKFGKVHEVKAWVKHSDRAPSREELKKMLSYADLSKKVIVIILASSGVRVSTLIGLKIGDIELGENNEPSKLTIRAEDSKTRKPYITFITPEVTALLKEYLDSRKRLGEELRKDSPLIRNERFSRQAKSMNVDGLTQNIRRLFRKAGLIEPAKGNARTRYQLHHHTLRKYFDTRLAVAGVQYAFKEYFLGHTGGLDRSYFRPTEDMLKVEYRKAIPHLTILSTTVISRAEVRNEVLTFLLGNVSELDLAP